MNILGVSFLLNRCYIWYIWYMIYLNRYLPKQNTISYSYLVSYFSDVNCHTQKNKINETDDETSQRQKHDLTKILLSTRVSWMRQITEISTSCSIRHWGRLKRINLLKHLEHLSLNFKLLFLRTWSTLYLFRFFVSTCLIFFWLKSFTKGINIINGP